MSGLFTKLMNTVEPLMTVSPGLGVMEMTVPVIPVPTTQGLGKVVF